MIISVNMLQTNISSEFFLSNLSVYWNFLRIALNHYTQICVIFVLPSHIISLLNIIYDISIFFLVRSAMDCARACSYLSKCDCAILTFTPGSRSCQGHRWEAMMIEPSGAGRQASTGTLVYRRRDVSDIDNFSYS